MRVEAEREGRRDAEPLGVDDVAAGISGLLADEVEPEGGAARDGAEREIRVEGAAGSIV